MQPSGAPRMIGGRAAPRILAVSTRPLDGVEPFGRIAGGPRTG